MKNIEKNCLQGLERQNKLFAKTICIIKNSKNFEKKMFAEVHKLKKKFADENFSSPPPKKIIVRPLLTSIRILFWNIEGVDRKFSVFLIYGFYSKCLHPKTRLSLSTESWLTYAKVV